jgi:hypothetical protein
VQGKEGFCRLGAARSALFGGKRLSWGFDPKSRCHWIQQYWHRLDDQDHADKQNAGAHESGLVVVLRDEGRLLAADRS